MRGFALSRCTIRHSRAPASACFVADILFTSGSMDTELCTKPRQYLWLYGLWDHRCWNSDPPDTGDVWCKRQCLFRPKLVLSVLWSECTSSSALLCEIRILDQLAHPALRGRCGEVVSGRAAATWWRLRCVCLAPRTPPIEVWGHSGNRSICAISAVSSVGSWYSAANMCRPGQRTSNGGGAAVCERIEQYFLAAAIRPNSQRCT